MKKFSLRLLPFFTVVAMMLLFAACEKEEINSIDTTPIVETPSSEVATSPVAARITATGTQSQSSSSTGGLEIECIEINFPFDFAIDGVSYTINDIAELDTLFATQFTANTMSADFVYPLNVTLEDGTTAVVADGSELAVLVSACVPGAGWGNGGFPAFFFDDPTCISISYPVILEDENGATVSVVDETEFVNLLAANPSYTFVFPINVIDTAGMVTSIVDEQALFDILAQCACPGSGGGHGGGNGGGHGVNPGDLSFLLGDSCFSYNYPISILDFQGNIVVVADQNALSTLLLNGDFLDFEYPFSVTLLADGSQVVVNDGNEFYNILFTCTGGTVSTSSGIPAAFFLAIAFDLGAGNCLTPSYPLVIENMDGTTTSIANETEAMAYLHGPADGLIQFPIDVIDPSTGTSITLDSEMDLFTLLDNCQ